MIPVVSILDVDFVGAGMRSSRLVGNALHCRVGDEVADELEFVGTGLLVVVGDRPDGATVQFDPIVAVSDLLTIGQITLSVEQLGDAGDSTVDRFVGEFVCEPFDESQTATLEHPIHQLGIFLFDVFQ